MRKIALMLLGFAALLTGCNVEETAIICGREWNPNLEVVADTASEFELKDQLIVQFRYGERFARRLPHAIFLHPRARPRGRGPGCPARR